MWELVEIMWSAEAGRTELDAYLDDGWEPFSAQYDFESGDTVVHLRREKHERAVRTHRDNQRA